MDDLQRVTIESYGLKYTVDMNNDVTWREVLDAFVKLLGCAGYHITLSKLEEWASETECVRD